MSEDLKINESIKTGCAIPNPNLKIIEEIEGLISQVNEKIEDLDVGLFGAVSANFDVSGKMKEREVSKSKALEEVDLFQKTTLLFKLKKAFINETVPKLQGKEEKV